MSWHIVNLCAIYDMAWRSLNLRTLGWRQVGDCIFMEEIFPKRDFLFFSCWSIIIKSVFWLMTVVQIGMRFHPGKWSGHKLHHGASSTHSLVVWDRPALPINYSYNELAQDMNNVSKFSWNNVCSLFGFADATGSESGDVMLVGRYYLQDVIDDLANQRWLLQARAFRHSDLYWFLWWNDHYRSIIRKQQKIWIWCCRNFISFVKWKKLLFFCTKIAEG